MAAALGGSEQLPQPLLKAGMVVVLCAPLILSFWGRGLDLALRTFPPSLCGGASCSDPTMEQSPSLALEPLPVPPLAGRESVLGIRPRATVSSLP